MGALLTVWFGCSSAMSLMAKYFFGKDRYGAPALFFTGMGFFVQYALALATGAFYGCLTRRRRRRATWREYLLRIAPAGVITALDIGASNWSYVFISVSFYTVCKSTAPMFLLMFAFCARIEKPSLRLTAILLVISVGVALTANGELEFDWRGFGLVMFASMMAGLRWLYIQVLLKEQPKRPGPAEERPGAAGGRGARAGAGGPTRGSNPIDLMVQITPVMGVLITSMALGIEKPWRDPTFTESKSKAARTWGYLVLFGATAFVMVWAEFRFLQKTSALTITIAGCIKEFWTILLAVLFFHDSFGLSKTAGLFLVLGGVFAYNLHKRQEQAEAREAEVGRLKKDRSSRAVDDDDDDDLPVSLPSDDAEGAAADGAPWAEDGFDPRETELTYTYQSHGAATFRDLANTGAIMEKEEDILLEDAEAREDEGEEMHLLEVAPSRTDDGDVR